MWKGVSLVHVYLRTEQNSQPKSGPVEEGTSKTKESATRGENLFHHELSKSRAAGSATDHLASGQSGAGCAKQGRSYKSASDLPSSGDVDAAISLSADAAIDTFRRLSEEIDTLKNRSFTTNNANKTRSSSRSRAKKNLSEDKKQRQVNKSLDEKQKSAESHTLAAVSQTNKRKPKGSAESLKNGFTGLPPVKPAITPSQQPRSHFSSAEVKPGVVELSVSRPAGKSSPGTFVETVTVHETDPFNFGKDMTSWKAEVNTDLSSKGVSGVTSGNDRIATSTPTSGYPSATKPTGKGMTVVSTGFKYQHSPSSPHDKTPSSFATGSDSASESVPVAMVPSAGVEPSRKHDLIFEHRAVGSRPARAPSERVSSAGNNRTGNASQPRARHAASVGEKGIVTSQALDANIGTRLLIEETGASTTEVSVSHSSAAAARSVARRVEEVTADVSAAASSTANRLGSDNNHSELEKTDSNPISGTSFHRRKTSMSDSGPVSRTGFRKLSSAERKRRLREVVLKYRAEESSSSDDESVFSDGHSSDSDVSNSWLGSVS